MNVCELDARVGGSFRFELENGNSIVGTYLLIVPPERLSFTWSSSIAAYQEMVVTVDFVDRGHQTEVVLTHERLNTAEFWDRAVAAHGASVAATSSRRPPSTLPSD
jgi:uncharacterized protein YndB with AHSA1/START domain